MKKTLTTLLINAVMNNQMVKVAKLLIERGADPNGCEDSLMYSPLHYAAAHSRPEIALLLLDAGADLNAKDSDGYTPLETAQLHNNKRFIALCKQRQLIGTGS